MSYLHVLYRNREGSTVADASTNDDSQGYWGTGVLAVRAVPSEFRTSLVMQLDGTTPNIVWNAQQLSGQSGHHSVRSFNVRHGTSDGVAR